MRSEVGYLVQDADDDGSGELDCDEFCEQLGPYLGKDLSKQQIMQLFMKIDADAGGTVDWDEFSNYMFLKKADNDEDSTACYRLFPAVRHPTSIGLLCQCASVHSPSSAPIALLCRSFQAATKTPEPTVT